MIRNFISTLVLLISGAFLVSADNIPLAGVFEGSDKVNGLSRHMYMVLDFVNGTPDFTQQFTTKESTFKVLPKDFMNAKKLSKAFSGQRAPGFSRYREKWLLANWEEMKIMNPRNRGGIIICDWIDSQNNKGKCAIVPLLNDSIAIYGLSMLDKEISSDGMHLELVKNLLLAGTRPIPPISISIDDIHKIEEPFKIDCGRFIEELEKIPSTPVTSNENTPNNESRSDIADNTGSKTDADFPILWREDGPVMYEFYVRDRGGDYGMFTTKSTLDFWPDEAVKGNNIACRWYYHCLYDNGRMYEGEYIYYGKKVGNKIVFTHRSDTLHGGTQIEALEEPSVMTSPDGKKLVFEDWTFTRTH